MKTEIKVVKNVTIPTQFTLKKQFYGKAVEILFNDVNRRIAKQQKADGSAIKGNAPSTKALKSKFGLKQISLVGFGSLHGGRGSGFQRSDHLFIGKAAYHQEFTNTYALLKPSAKAIEIAGYLDEMGYAVDEVIAISEKAQKRIFDLAKVSLRYMTKSAVSRAGR